MGFVHTRDDGPLCFVTDTKPTARRIMCKGSYLYALHEVSNQGGNTPRETPGGSQVELKL